jgi:Ni/Fe-hydrogenase subunit HybB-like protein
VEFSPVLFDHLGMKKAVRALHIAAIPIVIAGVILSTLHQSSMGSMFLIMPQKMYPLWYSPLLPVFFLVSSVAAGLCMPIIESFFAFRLFQEELPKPLLVSLARAASSVLFLLFVLRIIDVTARGAWGFVGTHRMLGFLFLLEVGGGILAPAILLAWPKFTARMRGLLIPAIFAAGGVVLSRLNVSWFSLSSSGARYVPTWMEISISLSLFTAMVALFGLAARTLPVFPPARALGSLTEPT